MHDERFRWHTTTFSYMASKYPSETPWNATCPDCGGEDCVLDTYSNEYCVETYYIFCRRCNPALEDSANAGVMIACAVCGTEMDAARYPINRCRDCKDFLCRSCVHLARDFDKTFPAAKRRDGIYMDSVRHKVLVNINICTHQSDVSAYLQCFGCHQFGWSDDEYDDEDMCRLRIELNETLDALQKEFKDDAWEQRQMAIEIELFINKLKKTMVNIK